MAPSLCKQVTSLFPVLLCCVGGPAVSAMSAQVPSCEYEGWSAGPTTQGPHAAQCTHADMKGPSLVLGLGVSWSMHGECGVGEAAASCRCRLHAALSPPWRLGGAEHAQVVVPLLLLPFEHPADGWQPAAPNLPSANLALNARWFTVHVCMLEGVGAVGHMMIPRWGPRHRPLLPRAHVTMTEHTPNAGQTLKHGYTAFPGLLTPLLPFRRASVGHLVGLS